MKGRVEKGREKEGERRGRRRGDGRGGRGGERKGKGREFVLCHRKKRKVGADDYYCYYYYYYYYTLVTYLLTPEIRVLPSGTLSQTPDLENNYCFVISIRRNVLRLHSTTQARPDPRGPARTLTDSRGLFRETRAADPGLRQSLRTLSGRVRSGPCSGI